MAGSAPIVEPRPRGAQRRQAKLLGNRGHAWIPAAARSRRRNHRRAEQILQIAFDRGVKVRTDADLVELLAAVDVDSEVPLEALAAVAEILSYVYRQTSPQPTSGAEASGAATAEPAEPELPQ